MNVKHFFLIIKENKTIFILKILGQKLKFLNRRWKRKSGEYIHILRLIVGANAVQLVVPDSWSLTRLQAKVSRTSNYFHQNSYFLTNNSSLQHLFDLVMVYLFRLWLWWTLSTFSTGLMSQQLPVRALMESLGLRCFFSSKICRIFFK